MFNSGQLTALAAMPRRPQIASAIYRYRSPLHFERCPPLGGILTEIPTGPAMPQRERVNQD